MDHDLIERNLILSYPRRLLYPKSRRICHFSDTLGSEPL